MEFSTMGSYKDLSELPTDTLNVIQEKIGKFSDYVRFCSVCQQWRCVGLDSHSHHKQSLQILKASHNKLPMLITQTKENNGGVRDLYSFTEGVTYDLKLPWAYDYRFFGSSLGWLFTVDKAMAISIVNPLTGGSVLLPVIEDPRIVFEEIWHERLYDYYTVKGLLTSDPSTSPNDYTAVVSFGAWHELAFYKPGFDEWKKIGKRSHWISDFFFYDSHVYCVDSRDSLLKIDTNSFPIKTIVEKTTLVHDGVTNITKSLPKVTYLVKSQDGDLLHIQRFWHVDEDCDDDLLIQTTKFKVFKLVHKERSSAKWVEINDLGNQSIFVGDNQSVSVSTNEFPECRANCIYFTDARHLYIPPYKYRGLHLEDSGVFDLKDGNF